MLFRSEVASKTNDLAGDGTTTATVLAQAIVKEGLKNVAAGANPMDLKRGIDKAVEAIVADLSKQAKVVGSDSNKIKQIASISANNDEVIGELIANAFAKVGKEGVITVCSFGLFYRNHAFFAYFCKRICNQFANNLIVICRN